MDTAFQADSFQNDSYQVAGPVPSSGIDDDGVISRRRKEAEEREARRRDEELLVLLT